MSYVDEVIERVKRENPNEPEFHQAVKEVLESLRPVIDENEEFCIVEPYNLYGLAAHDFIVLDASRVKSGDII